MVPNIIFGIFGKFQVSTKCWTLDPLFIAEMLKTYKKIAWDEHVGRSRSGCKWNLSLLAFHDASWLQQQRFAFAAVAPIKSNPWTVFAGRTGTRAQAGKVQPRWQEAIQKVRNRTL